VTGFERYMGRMLQQCDLEQAGLDDGEDVPGE
jgi:hypothetical protein